MKKKLALLACSFALFTTGAIEKSAQAAPAQKDWTFLVYLNGNNNLDSFGAMNINQMEQVGSTDKVNVVVQWASLRNKKTQRLFIQKDNDTKKVTSPVVQDLGKVDMGDYRSLVEFVRWAADNYPAKHFFINVWDHGSGWHAISAQIARENGTFHPTDISWDDNTGNSISTAQLGQAMSEAARIIGHKVDVYASDACLMAMAEVAGEMRDSVRVYAGSQELEPGAGWPYQNLLAKWNALPEASATDVGKILTNEYVASYNGGVNGRDEVTFSAYDLDQSDKFYRAVSELGRTMKTLDAPSRKAIVAAASKAQIFTYEDYNDLIDFVDLVEKSEVASVAKGALTGMRSAIDTYVIANATTKKYARAHGVSIWLPHDMSTFNSYSNLYSTLRFQKDTGWADAVQYVLQQ